MSEAAALPRVAVLLSGADLARIIPRCIDPNGWAEPLRRACVRFRISTSNRLAAFLAQTGHESGNLNTLSESLDYTPARLIAVWPKRFTPELAQDLGRTQGHAADQPKIAQVAYGGRMGNTQPGMAWAHRGAGLIQVTGYDNHRELALFFGLKVEDVPDWLRTKEGAAMGAARWWSARGMNELADAGAFDTICMRVNGATTVDLVNGLADRRARYQRALAVLTQ